MKILDRLKKDLAISTFKGLENHIVSLVGYKKIKIKYAKLSLSDIYLGK